MSSNMQQQVNECPICCDSVGTCGGVSVTQCDHYYCTPCISTALSHQDSCPMCNREHPSPRPVDSANADRHHSSAAPGGNEVRGLSTWAADGAAGGSLNASEALARLLNAPAAPCKLSMHHVGSRLESAMPTDRTGISSDQLKRNLHSLVVTIQSMRYPPAVWEAQLLELQDLIWHLDAEAIVGTMMPWHTVADSIVDQVTRVAADLGVFMNRRHARQVQQQQQQQHQQRHQMHQQLQQHQHGQQHADLGELARNRKMLQLMGEMLQLMAEMLQLMAEVLQLL